MVEKLEKEEEEAPEALKHVHKLEAELESLKEKLEQSVARVEELTAERDGLVVTLAERCPSRV